MKLSTKEKNFVQCLRVARVATVASDGVPHNVRVCPVFENNRIYFVQSEAPGKCITLMEIRA